MDVLCILSLLDAYKETIMISKRVFSFLSILFVVASFLSALLIVALFACCLYIVILVIAKYSTILALLLGVLVVYFFSMLIQAILE